MTPRKVSPSARKSLLPVALAVLLAAGGWVVFSGWQEWRRRTVEQRINRYADLIRRHAEQNRLPVELVRSVIRVESGGEPSAVSRAGAKGLMQILPAAEQDVLARLKIPPRDLFEPDYNILIGTAYLGQLVRRFKGDAYLALAAYNRGPTWVEQHCRDHPRLSGRQIVEQFAPAETRRYCRDILGGRTMVFNADQGAKGQP